MPRIKTEQAWLKSTTPQSLLLTLKGKRLPRQRRLLAVACCRRWLGEMLDPESRLAVEVAERYADGLAGRDELEAAYRAAQEVVARRLAPCLAAAASEANQLWGVWRLAHAAEIACAPGSSDLADLSGELLKRAARLGAEPEEQEKMAQCARIRDIFGNPFRPPPAIASSWLSWNDGTIPRLAHAAYEDRDLPAGTLRPVRLAVLADALEEAGCTEAGLVNHLRAPGPHLRGCFVLDLLLRKE